MIVTEHRSALKRIDYAIKPRAPESVEAEHIKAARELDAKIANDRVWRLLRQSAEGCNPSGEA